MLDLRPTLAQLQTQRSLIVGGLPASAQGYVLGLMAEQSRTPIIHIAPSDREMEAVALACRHFAPKIDIITLPAWDCLPYDRVSPAHAITAERIQALCRLARLHSGDYPIVLTTMGAALQRQMPRALLADASFNLKAGVKLKREALIAFLVANGYARVGKVMEPGEFALRGSIIDLFPPTAELAVRIDLFDTDIETIKWFDPLTQVSTAPLESLVLQPVSEVLLNEETIARFRMGYRDLFGAVTKDDPLYESISAGRHYAGAEHWLPLFYDHLDTLFDYLPSAIVSIDHAALSVKQDRQELLLDYYQARTAPTHKGDGIYHPLPPAMLYVPEAEWATILKSKPVLTLSAFKSEAADDVALPIKAAPDFAVVRNQPDGDVFVALKAAIEARKKPTHLACYSAGSMDRISKMLVHHGLSAQAITLTSLPLEHGFETPDFLILSEQDLLGERVIRTTKRKRQSDAFMLEASSFSEGELVVHKDHGIGRFEGLVTVEVNGRRHDCLKLIYAGEDKLFLPVENMELIARFGSDAEGVQLDKLGSVSWQKRKAAMKQRIRMAAEELLKIAAKRSMREAPALAPMAEAYSEFCARFPYSETEDQQTAIDDVLTDMVAGKPMDRLICGDVGFGKTEVALRAAFAAVGGDHPVQVAVVTPTTLLCRQHFLNFQKRFSGLPYEVRQLSRLVSGKQSTENKTQLKEGKVDIVIGTHALLSKSIEFKNLGLVIVDEEQHFGVAQKERLKQLRSNTHVLTLSATPIPRTLQMALSGVRELSLITTPPVDRLAVRSFVMPYDGVVLREAILREFHRGGKVFYVTPRIHYMADLKAKLLELVPEIRICVAHGQMPPAELDGLMNDFYDGKYDLLLSTAIIESGLDVPSANTMIIDHAEMFGLAQLYQLRGRVGRGKIRAYCYFTLPHRKTLTATATKRLEVMQQLDTLGAGFQLASHDMDIRGFGNLLGEEQSGHVREVGIELYQHMLEDMIDQLRRGKGMERDEAASNPDDWSPQINLGTSVLIPDTYVEDLDLRISLYRRLSRVDSSEEIDSFMAELVDRFGPTPPEVDQLMEVLRVKQLCKRAGIERLDTGPKGAVFSFRNNSFANPEALLALIALRPKQFKLRPDHKLVYMDQWRNEKERFTKLNQSIEAIVKLAS